MKYWKGIDTALCLLPHNPDLNLMRNIWAEVKGHVASTDVTCNMEDVKHWKK
jgi:hypothetical protein